MTFPTFRCLTRPAAACFLAFATLTPALAHDFWLRPDIFHAQSASTTDPVTVSVKTEVGHPEDKSAWPLTPWRVVSVRSLGPDGWRDQHRGIGDGAIDMSFTEEGVYMVSFASRVSTSDLPAERFNDYVEEEGLTPVALHRLENDLADENGTETYSRRGKTFIRVGDAEAQAFITEPIGQSLEIVPDSDPTRLVPGEPFTAHIYWRGRPAKGVRVALVSLDDDSGDRDVLKSDALGQISVSTPPEGSWMLHAIWADVLPDDQDYDYDTVFSSLSFAVMEPAR